MDYVAKKSDCELACGYQLNANGEQCFFNKDLNDYKWKKTTSPCMKWFTNVTNYYEYLPKPLEDEWLSHNKESGQTFKNYTRVVKKSRNLKTLDSAKSSIVLFTFKMDETILSEFILNGLKEFIGIYFDSAVKFDETHGNLDSRFKVNQDDNRIQCERALSVFKTFKQKNDSSIVAITTCDLAYNNSFVFGLTDPELQVCVISLYRYILHLLNNNDLNEVTILKKTASVICHEVAHSFGLEHCIYYRCIMNGANTIDEDDKLPLYLCPICLKKLHFLMNFDIELRYTKLMEFCLKYNFESEYEWYKKRLAQTE